MKKIFGLIAALVLLIALLPLQQAAANTEARGHYTASKTLSVYEKPTPRAKVIGSLKKGTTVFVYNTEPGGWSKIKYKNKAGYVSSSQLKNKAGKSPAKATPVLMKDIKFNMTANQVKAKETRQLAFQEQDLLAYYATKYQEETLLVYFFENNRLNFVMYDFNPDEIFYTYEELGNAYYYLNNLASNEFGENYYDDFEEGDDYDYYSSLWTFDQYSVLLQVHNDTEEGIDNLTLAYVPDWYIGASSEEEKEKQLGHAIKELEKHRATLDKR